MTQSSGAEVQLLEPFTVDEATVKAIRHTGWVAAFPYFILGAWLLIDSVRTGIKEGSLTGVVVFLLGTVVCGLLVAIYNLLILGPFRAVRYRTRVKAIAADIPNVGLTPTMIQTWAFPYPGVIAIDRARALVFIQSEGTGHQRFVLGPDNIVGVKVEREGELHTQSQHSGYTASGDHVGTFRGSSKSKTTTVEKAFLEIHYQFDSYAAPGWFVVPFGTDRRAADSMAAVIQGLQARNSPA